MTTASRFESGNMRLIQRLIQQKQAEAALRESEEKLRLFIQRAPVSVAILDRKMHYITASQR